MINALHQVMLDLYNERSKISSREALDTVINKSLTEIGHVINADRVYIFDYDWTDETSSNTYEWCNNDIKPQIEYLQKVPMNSIKLWVNSHKAGQAVIIHSVENLKNIDLKNILEAQEIKSLYAFPITVNDRCIGFYGIDYVKSTSKLSAPIVELLYKYNDIYLMLFDTLTKNNVICDLKKEVEALKNSRQNFYNYMTHHLKTPLNILIGHMKILEDAINTKYYETMEKAAFDLNKLINASIKLSKSNIYDRKSENQYFDLLELAEYFASLSKYSIELSTHNSYAIYHKRDHYYYLLFYVIDLLEKLDLKIKMLPLDHRYLSISFKIKFDKNITDLKLLNSSSYDLNQSYKAFQWELIKQLIDALDGEYKIEKNIISIEINSVLYKNKSEQPLVQKFINYEPSKILLIDGIQMHNVILRIILKGKNIAIDHLYSSQLLEETLNKSAYDLILFSSSEIVTIKELYQKDLLSDTNLIAIGDKNILNAYTFVADQIFVPIERNQTLKIFNKFLKQKCVIDLQSEENYQALLDQYKNIKDYFVIDEIEKFSEAILEYAQKYQNKTLMDYGVYLKKAVTDLNITEIEELLTLFDSFIE